MMKCLKKVVMMMKACNRHLQHISYLMNMHFQRLWKPYMIIIVVLTISSIAGIVQSNDAVVAFEVKFYESFLCLRMFAICVIAWCCYCIFDSVRLNKKSQIQERLHVLPISRMDIIGSHILSIMVSLIAICIIESIIFLVAFYINAVSSQVYSISTDFYYAITNAIYSLAFMPLTITGGLKVLSSIFFISTFVEFIAQCFRYLLKCKITVCIILAGCCLLAIACYIRYFGIRVDTIEYLQVNPSYQMFIQYFDNYQLYHAIMLICSFAMLRSLFKLMKRKYI